VICPTGKSLARFSPLAAHPRRDRRLNSRARKIKVYE
jgi:hypothetical protein